MATKYIESNRESRKETMRQNWEVMKPFVHFAFKAMVIMGGAVISIVKLLPSLLEHHENSKKDKRDKIIKI
jgi:hypothetical protein